MAEKCNDTEIKEMMDECTEIHALWYALNDYLEKTDRNINELSGYDDIRHMDAFCKKHPEVIRVHVDDEHHCNSYVYIIPHEGKTRYMGATVVFVPQCCNAMNQFFLYPSDNRALLNACLRLEDKYQEKGDPIWKEMNGDLNEDGDKDTKG